jgi:hypothetical protein
MAQGERTARMFGPERCTRCENDPAGWRHLCRFQEWMDENVRAEGAAFGGRGDEDKLPLW